MVCFENSRIKTFYLKICSNKKMKQHTFLLLSNYIILIIKYSKKKEKEKLNAYDQFSQIILIDIVVVLVKSILLQIPVSIPIKTNIITKYRYKTLSTKACKIILQVYLMVRFEVLTLTYFRKFSELSSSIRHFLSLYLRSTCMFFFKCKCRFKDKQDHFLWNFVLNNNTT